MTNAEKYTAFSKAWPGRIKEVIHDLAKEGKKQNMQRPCERNVAKKGMCKPRLVQQKREHVV